MAQITIYDVAKRAGVSIATVSNVLNSPARVRAKTLERVLHVIDELGFVPKTEAALNARKGVGRIGVLAPFTTYPSFTQRLHGVMQAFRDQPYELVVYDQSSLAVREDYLTTLPVTRRLDGLIVMSLPFSEGVNARLLRHELQTVLVEFARPEFSSVDIDNYEGGCMAAKHLLARGHTRCAFVGEQQLSALIATQGTKRLKGFKDALESAGVGLPDTYISLGPYGVEEARQQARSLLELPEPPSAIFTHSDMQAVGVLRAAKDKGMDVPKDLAVVGFDDLGMAEHFGLTTIRQPLFESGQVAARLLLDQRKDPTRLTQQVRLPVSLIERESS